MPFRLTFVLSLVIALVATLVAAPEGLVREPTPVWAQINQPGSPAQADTVTGGVNYLLSDQQWRLDPIENYVRYTYLVTHSSGLQDAAELSFTYAPEYERLGFHKIEVIRDGQVIDQLDLDKFEVLREERDRNYGLYDGRLTAVLNLPDVRVGDIIDYAYTRHGQNPIFDGKFQRRFSTGWSVPLGHQFVRVTVPAGRKLFTRNLGPDSSLHFSSVQDGSARVLTWEAQDPAILQADKATPSWYWDFPYAQLSEFADWQQVVDWALPLYPLPPVSDEGRIDDPKLQAELERIRADSDDAESQLLAALKLVQENVRYLGYELGEGSHRPRPAVLTWEQRFGDCKDKTLLFCTLARSLGWDASPALVHSSRGQRLPMIHPSAYAFNHVIATVRLPDGSRLWFDPTDSDLAGDLEQHTSPDYHHALIVAAGEQDITEMSLPESALGRTRLEIDYTSHGYDVPGDIKVVTIHQGMHAHSMRARLRNTTLSELGRDYLEYYADTYPGITATSPLSVDDNTETNVITLTEAYSIPVLWKPTGDDDKQRELQLGTTLIGDYITKPASGPRTTPLGITHPRNTEEQVTVHLHTNWEIEPFNRTVDNIGFHYEKAGRIDQEGRRLRLNYVYRTKQDFIPTESVTSYLEDVDSINASIGYVLTHTPEDASTGPTDTDAAATATGVNLRTISAMGFVVFIGIVVWIRLLLRGPSKEPPPLPESADDPIGIRGWLVLPAIGLILRPIMIIVTMAQSADGYFSETTWQVLIANGSELPTLILLEAAGNTASIVMALIGLWLFFSHRRETRAWMITLLIFSSSLLIADTLALHWIQDTTITDEDSLEIIKSVIVSAIWVAYFVKSRRVKRTFTR